jgi:ribosomal protein L32
MLPQRPHTFDAGFNAENSNIGPAAVAQPEARADHHCQICPNCAHRLTSHRCKLVCGECGYYMSCADYY